MPKKSPLKLNPLKSYPTPDQIDVGCKVSWHGYKDKDKAEEASKAARHNGEILAAQGFDFGYQSPGEIRAPHSAANRIPGFYTVTLP
jgi:hypothetical protein